MDDDHAARALRAAIRARRLVWLSGDDGARKAALVRLMLGDAAALRIRGRRLRSPDAAAAHLAHLAGIADDGWFASATWFAAALDRLPGARPAIVLEELDLASDEVAAWLVHALRRRASGMAFVCSRAAPKELVEAQGVHHLALSTLSPSAQRQVRWVDVPAGLRASMCTLLLRDETPLGASFGETLVPATDLCALRELRLVDEDGCVPRQARDALLEAAYEDSRRPAVERQLAREILDRARPDAVALRTAAALLVASPDAPLLRRLSKHWGPTDGGPERLQNELDRLALRGRLAPRARMLVYRGNAEGYNASLQRDIHDAFIEAPRPGARLLAHLSLVRAAVWSGLSELPLQIGHSLDLLEAGAPQSVRAQVALM